MTKNDFAVAGMRIALDAICAGRLGLAKDCLEDALCLLGPDDAEAVDRAVLEALDGGHK